ncbi:hypothetical protein V5F79_17575 [Xanthobacter flavus]|uniref:hypothetical protein n=1 Tax=Xanthobacter flavus TaxID=281 RepID=UPI00372B259E
MSISYSTTLKNSRLSAVVTAIGASGYMEICTTGYGTVLATIPLGNPAGSVSAGVLTLTTPASDASADATGAAAVARIKDGSNNVVASGLTVGTTGTDIILASTSIVAAQVVTLNSATITHAA